MRLLIVTDHIFIRSHGLIYDNYCFDRSFFSDYRSVFQSVVVRARAEDNPLANALNSRLSCGDGVSFSTFPAVRGWKWILVSNLSDTAETKQLLEESDAVVIRAPSFFAHRISRLARRMGKPCMIEVIGDPEEAIASVGGGLLVKLIAGISKLLMKHVVAEANVVSYVNSSTLPDKYPPLKAIAWDSISSIRLDRKYLATRREYKEPLKDIRLLYVGTLTERKRVRDLVSAVGILKARKVSITLTIVGDGPLRQALQDQSRRLGLESDCHFIGQLPGLESILPHIDESDLFVMPSASEGLPRAVIEAMARGTPVVGTRVQGTSELVPREDTYPVEEVETLAKLIQDVTSNPARLNSMSTYSIETATKYIDDILSAKRRRLYQNLRELGTLQ